MSYSAVFLTPQSKQALKKWWTDVVGINLHSSVYMDHMTLKFQPTSEERNSFPRKSLVTLEILGYGADSQGQAVVVRCRRAPSMNQIAHITVATSMTPPVYSNSLLQKEWTPVIDAPILFGVVDDHSYGSLSSEALATIAALDETLSTEYFVVPKTENLSYDWISTIYANEGEKEVNLFPKRPPRHRLPPDESDDELDALTVLNKIFSQLPPTDLIICSCNKEHELSVHSFVFSCISNFFRSKAKFHIDDEQSQNQQRRFYLDAEDDWETAVEIIVWIYFAVGFLLKGMTYKFNVAKIEQVSSAIELAAKWEVLESMKDVFISYLHRMITSYSSFDDVISTVEKLKLSFLDTKTSKAFSEDICKCFLVKYSNVATTIATNQVLPLTYQHAVQIIQLWIESMYSIEVKNDILNKYRLAEQAHMDVERKLMEEFQALFSVPCNDDVNAAEILSSKSAIFVAKWSPLLQSAMEKRFLADKEKSNVTKMEFGFIQKLKQSELEIVFSTFCLHSFVSSSDDDVDAAGNTCIKDTLMDNDWKVLKYLLLYSNGDAISTYLFPLLSKLKLSPPFSIIAAALCKRKPVSLSETSSQGQGNYSAYNVEYDDADYYGEYDY